MGSHLMTAPNWTTTTFTLPQRTLEMRYVHENSPGTCSEKKELVGPKNSWEVYEKPKILGRFPILFLGEPFLCG